MKSILDIYEEYEEFENKMNLFDKLKNCILLYLVKNVYLIIMIKKQ